MLCYNVFAIFEMFSAQAIFIRRFATIQFLYRSFNLIDRKHYFIQIFFFQVLLDHILSD